MLFYCVRHGQSLYNAEGRIQGQSGSGLSELGRRQSQAAAQVLCDQPIDAVYSSPLQRAMETAEAIAAALDLPIRTEPRLMEINAGILQNQIRADLERLYTIPVREALAGKANVHRPKDNCGPTIRGLQELDEWLGSGRWDVIHFNFGLHDLRNIEGKHQVPLDAYEKNLRQITERLKKTGAALIWCSTTPVPEGCEPGRKAGDEVAFNAAAKKIMDENHVAIDDLCAFARPRLKDIQMPKNVHFTAEGSKGLAGQVAKSILAALAARKH